MGERSFIGPITTASAPPKRDKAWSRCSPEAASWSCSSGSTCPSSPRMSKHSKPALRTSSRKEASVVTTSGLDTPWLFRYHAAVSLAGLRDALLLQPLLEAVPCELLVEAVAHDHAHACGQQGVDEGHVLLQVGGGMMLDARLRLLDVPEQAIGVHNHSLDLPEVLRLHLRAAGLVRPRLQAFEKLLWLEPC
eukprot:CAMPEP_0181417532 /NCGR_PEP_ID=MMETSP1110-20121109/11089_1 /TAXON_ID=174948 /ORGANISM="Symbiodinium sp., Strain CCMP421" /LENGTH=191 /DNA_ID=CAMNT_0023540485 /DNA_START=363 /DNA_END=938 /DNA_ORIENTATION=+